MLPIALVFLLPALLAASDLDQDGLSDPLEQQLVEQFAPLFILSAGECDGMPAEFQPASQKPKPVARNGTIYTQVFPRELASGRFAEIHYYHLWTRDCGRSGHTLDVEHVSALVYINDEGWKAAYWYSSAHQGTVCDASQIVPAAEVMAQDHGPVVWISKGKHASFLAGVARRGGGCGADVFGNGRKLAVAKWINVGEPGHPLNGSTWIEAKDWPLSEKMFSDFEDAAVRASSLPLDPRRRSTQAVIRVSNSTSDQLLASQRSTTGALSTAEANTGASLVRATRSVQSGLRAAVQFVGLK